MTFPRKKSISLKSIALAALSALSLTVLAPATASAQAWAARHGMTGAQYQAEFNKFTGQGYRLTDVSGYRIGDQMYYAAIWSKAGGGAWVARHGMSSGGYQNAFNDITSKGYVPLLVDADAGNFAAIWGKARGAWVARHGLSSSAYQAEFDKWTGQGYRLVDVTGYEQGGKARYAAIWRKAGGGAWVARHGMTSAQYQAEFNKWTAQGYKPAHVDGYKVGGTVLYTAIWTKSGGAYVARHGLTGAQYQAEFTKWTSQGYRLHDVDGYDGGGSARYAAIWYK